MSESRAAYFREYRAKRAAIRAEGGLLPFQSAFVAAVCRKETSSIDCSLEHSKRKWEKLAGRLFDCKVTYSGRSAPRGRNRKRPSGVESATGGYRSEFLAELFGGGKRA